jgi:hypothetical protein
MGQSVSRQDRRAAPRDQQSPKSAQVSAYSPTKTHDYKQEWRIQLLLREEIEKNPVKNFALAFF